MRINYFSDVHLEFGDQKLPDNDADIVVAAGDIGVYDQGFNWLANINKPVIYVAGNHEFYQGEYHGVVRMLRHKCEGTRIRFLEKDEFVYRGVRFLGCTLWADLFVEGEEKAELLGKGLNDFHRMSFEDGFFDEKRFSALHHDSLAWLRAKLAKPFPGKTVVVTHHAPTEWSWIGDFNAVKKLAYCNNLKHLFHEYEIAVWFHGHVHNHGDYRVADGRILSNTRGYVGRRLVENFDINRVVDL